MGTRTAGPLKEKKWGVGGKKSEFKKRKVFKDKSLKSIMVLTTKSCNDEQQLSAGYTSPS